MILNVVIEIKSETDRLNGKNATTGQPGNGGGADRRGGPDGGRAGPGNGGGVYNGSKGVEGGQETPLAPRESA